MNGYRYYDTHQYDVLYPFGYGLNYADIRYKKVDLKVQRDKSDAYVQIQVSLENQSPIGGQEVVQVYVGFKHKDLVKPKKELKAFTKVFVHASKQANCIIDVPLEAFETYSEKEHKFVVYNGSYQVFVGQNSRDIVFEEDVVVKEGIDYKPVMDLSYPVDYLVEYYPKWAAYIEEHFRPLWWHEKEEPIARILDRYKRHKKIKEQDFEDLVRKIKEDIHV